jgi:hypothetical protein
VQRRMEVLWLKAHAEPHKKIAKLAGVSRATVQRTLGVFESGSLTAVRTFDWKTPASRGCTSGPPPGVNATTRWGRSTRRRTS